MVARQGLKRTLKRTSYVAGAAFIGVPGSLLIGHVGAASASTTGSQRNSGGTTVTYQNANGVTGTPIPLPESFLSHFANASQLKVQVLGTFKGDPQGSPGSAAPAASGGTETCDFDGILEAFWDLTDPTVDFVDWGGSVVCSGDEMSYLSIVGTLYKKTGSEFKKITGPVQDSDYATLDVGTPTEVWACGDACPGNTYKAHFHAEIDAYTYNPALTASGDCVVDSNNHWAVECTGYTTPPVTVP